MNGIKKETRSLSMNRRPPVIGFGHREKHKNKFKHKLNHSK